MPFSGREPKMNCKGVGACRLVWFFGFFFLFFPKPWLLFYKFPSDTYVPEEVKELPLLKNDVLSLSTTSLQGKQLKSNTLMLPST